MEDNSRILKLDMRDFVLQVLSRERFNTESHNYTTVDIHYDTYLNMPAVRSSLSFEIGGERYTLSGDFVLDLGNAAFLFLLKQSSVVEDFLKNNPDIKWRKAYNKRGILIAEAISADQNTLCGRTFGKQVVAITATLPRFTSVGKSCTDSTLVLSGKYWNPFRRGLEYCPKRTGLGSVSVFSF